MEKGERLIKDLGFKFQFDPLKCQECGGKCCTGESGYIFASIQELEKIAQFLEIPFEDFVLKYVKKAGYKFSLLEKPFKEGFACVFFDEKKHCCMIYEARPKQCRDFPFWDIYRNEENIPILLRECIGVKELEERE